MSEHRRKPPQPQGGGRAAARRAAQQPSGRRAARPTGSPDTSAHSPSGSYGSPSAPHAESSHGGRAEARRAQRGGGRRRGPDGAGPPGGPGRRAGRGGAGGGRPPKKRFIDYPRSGKQGWRRWVPSWKLVSACCLGCLGLLVAFIGVAYYMVAIPDVAQAAKAQNNVYYWADGSQMVATGGEVNRQIIPYEQIPAAMRYAVISAENKTFETDSGVDPQGIARAVLNMAKGGQTQGGSTITQQYVKNAQLNDQSQTITRKFKELFISIKVGATRQKSEIMAGYLNTAYYGRGAYGLQAAARTYYSKDAKDLDPSQCAFLASLLKGATYFDPAGAPEIDPAATAEQNTKNATERWGWILDQEVKDKHMDAAERAKYKVFPMPDKPKKNANLGGQIGYLVSLAQASAKNNNPDIDLAKGGYQIYTTFDKKKVQEMESVVKQVRDKNIDPKKRPKYDTFVQFGAASVDVKTGALVAIYGGDDATKHFTNNADETGAQVGSTFKPFVLAAGMQYGKRDPNKPASQSDSSRTPVSPDSIYSGKNKLKIKNYDGTIWKDQNGGEWLQTNDGDESYNPPSYAIDLRYAMQESVNTPYVQLGMDVGTDKVKQAAMAAGLRDSKTSMASSSVPSFSIGTSSPSAIRMAGAYATFAASGTQRDPFSVTSVKKDGNTIYKHEDQTKSAFPAAVANNVTDVLKGVVDKGTGTNAKLSGRQVAGKTGTTDGNRSAWFVGYTPQYSTAVGMYRLDDNETSKKREFLKMFGTGGQEKIHGASFPSTIWHDYMEQALGNSPAETFPAPEKIGDKVYGGGMSPAPSAPPSSSPSPSQSPSGKPSSTPSMSPSPSPSSSCSKWDWTCNDTGGTNQGPTNGGVDGGISPSPTPSRSKPGNGPGGWIAGPNG
ncbi:transglycosylase domain-containing protein [Streptomyces violascens]|uniref:Penicillin-binding protein n=1 Tax=Streptomyces violascens TaxID=67381 RepID=A0ABQ3QN69_9ACTN|nr:transglycosylase domain-containing protein [Streptomyces violascens]GGU42240.1 penicillin-binding protein [Streptomyces violascens]GHI38715.1 penicillin-binding protein [Streptomyces violascens]